MAKSETRDRVVTFRVTDGEYDRLEKARVTAGLSSVSDFCRTTTLGLASPEQVRNTYATASILEAASNMESALAQAKALLNPKE